MKGFQKTTEELKVQVIVKRLQPAVQRRDHDAMKPTIDTTALIRQSQYDDHRAISF